MMPGPNYYAYYGHGEPEPKKEEDKTWAILTQYDIVHRRAHIELEGRKTRRMKDIDNYIDFINNDMHPDYRVVTVMHPEPYNARYDEYAQAWLYKQDEDGRFVPSRPMRAMREFLGDKVTLQDDQAFVINNEIGYAVPANEYVRMIDVQTQDGYMNGYAKRTTIEYVLRKELGLDTGEFIGGSEPTQEDEDTEFDS